MQSIKGQTLCLMTDWLIKEICEVDMEIYRLF